MSNSFKEIAVLVAGVDEEYQGSVINGINSCARDNNANISYFSGFSGVISNGRYDVGEYNIYNLVNYEKFDGVILMTNTIGDPIEKDKIISKVKEAGIPVVVLDCDDYPEFINISIDNTAAMREIVKHVITVHGAKKINYISGPLANPEAEDRYGAFLSVMAEHGIEVESRRVFFGEFRAIDGVRAINKFVSSKLPMPDAIICANDAMALAAAAELEKLGYEIPKDIIVTGFDYTYNARHYSPALTTVARPLKEMGYSACELLLKVISGEQCEPLCLDAHPVFSESCGCNSDNCNDIKDYKKSTFKIINGCRSDISLLNRMTSMLAETESSDDAVEIIGSFLNELECERCSLCLISEWDSGFSSQWSDDEDNNDRVYGYSKKMSAPLIWEDGRKSSVDSFNSADMFPVPCKGGGNISYFLPLHFRERCLGYYIITNGDFPVKSMLCHSLMMNISNSIENIRKLIHLNSVITELDRLYVIDPLCGIYNRNGFIRTADNIFKKCRDKGTILMISFIDMDGLKYINDNFGHKEGDFALQRLASAISSCCKNKNRSICARFGGDEFIILGADAVEEDIEALEKTFMKSLENLNHIVAKPYEIAASIGTIVTPIEEDMKLFSLITQADKLMYERKKRKKNSKYLRK